MTLRYINLLLTWTLTLKTLWDRSDRHHSENSDSHPVSLLLQILALVEVCVLWISCCCCFDRRYCHHRRNRLVVMVTTTTIIIIIILSLLLNCFIKHVVTVLSTADSVCVYCDLVQLRVALYCLEHRRSDARRRQCPHRWTVERHLR